LGLRMSLNVRPFVRRNNARTGSSE
jgi:hypothetical protein